jgi:glycosyltransferase involved in cell wall biosynthesis
MPTPPLFRKYNIAAVIPAYRVEAHIVQVLEALPDYLTHVIVVDDASPDSTPDLVAAATQRDARRALIRHPSNQGVGGAMITGFQKALELGAQIIVKIDGDGQMDPADLPALLLPLIEGQADYTKGNRFRDFRSLQRMPFVRRIANMALSFATKAASGYWNCFDPANGFFAIRAEVLARLPFEQLDRGYFFETSMLANLYMLEAFVLDVPIPARYGTEVSNLSIYRSAIEFPVKLIATFIRRIALKYFMYDFSMLSVYLLVGIPLLLFGLIFGITKWIQYAQLGTTAPTGTIMLPTLSLIVGIQILLSAIEIDMQAVPRRPLTGALD